MNSLNLAIQGNFAESVAEILHAKTFVPSSRLTNLFGGLVLYLCRKFEEAIVLLENVLELAPRSVKILTLISMAYLQQSMITEARASLKRARSMEPANMNVLAWLGYANGLEGRKREVQKVLIELKKARKRRGASSFDYVLVYMGLGEKTQALDWLEQAYRDRHCCLFTANVDPIFDPLRSEPRFQNLMRRLGFGERV